MNTRAPAGAAIIAILAFLLAGLAYLPGLGGHYLVDDYSSLGGLGGIRDEPSWYAALKYVLTGTSSELGRPLALLTFAAQWNSWDQRPADFIAVNILLHLLNGALWLGCVWRLQRLGAVPQAPLLPALACALWLLLPFHVSTVLYIVQRMTLLAALFVLGGAWLYLSGREAASRGALRRGYVLMALGVAVAVGAGTLAKETAVLAPLLLLALESTVLRASPRPSGWRLWSAACLWLPGAVLIAYMAARLPGFADGHSLRTFTLGERLLTEARLLFQYLGEALLPRSSARLHYDDYPLSVSVLAPWTTALALAGWAALVAVAIARRRTWPLLALAVAWFLIGHLLESTVVPLEIGFAHRNYVPLLGVTLALACGFAQLATVPVLARMRTTLRAAGAAYLAALGTCLWLAASLWGQPQTQASHWAQRQPESRRAVHDYGRVLLQGQHVEEALAWYRAAWAKWPDEALFPLSLYEMGCFHPDAAPPTDVVRRTVERYTGANVAGTAALARGLAAHVADGRCPQLNPADVLSLLETLETAPRFVASRFALLYASVGLLDAMGESARALARLEQAIELDPQVPLLQQAIVWRLQRGEVPPARQHLQTLEISARITPLRRWLFRKEIAGTRQLVELYESMPGQPPA